MSSNKDISHWLTHEQIGLSHRKIVNQFYEPQTVLVLDQPDFFSLFASSQRIIWTLHMKADSFIASGVGCWSWRASKVLKKSEIIIRNRLQRIKEAMQIELEIWILAFPACPEDGKNPHVQLFLWYDPLVFPEIKLLFKWKLRHHMNLKYVIPLYFSGQQPVMTEVDNKSSHSNTWWLTWQLASNLERSNMQI